jgi:toxin ParE1/3/4
MGNCFKSHIAEQDLLEIWLQIAQHDILAADRMIDLIESRCDVIRRFPLGGEACPTFGSDLRWYFAEHFVIFYRPIANGIEVVRVIDGRGDLPRTFRQGR